MQIPHKHALPKASQERLQSYRDADEYVFGSWRDQDPRDNFISCPVYGSDLKAIFAPKWTNNHALISRQEFKFALELAKEWTDSSGHHRLEVERDQTGVIAGSMSHWPGSGNSKKRSKKMSNRAAMATFVDLDKEFRRNWFQTKSTLGNPTTGAQSQP